MKLKPKTTLVFPLLLCLFSSSGSAITRRTDVSDSAYVNYALNDFACSGKITGPWMGSATLISSNWVVTAKHVVNSSQPFTFSTANGTSREIVETVLHPTLDLALARLESDILDIAPTKLFSYEFGNDFGVNCVIAGAGMTGTGETGQISGTQGICRAGQEYALYHGDAWAWDSNLIITKFRSPSSGGLAFEGGAAQGDSGGGMFINVNGQWCIAGAMSLVWRDGTPYGAYNHSGGAYVNTTPYNDWILSFATNAVVVPEPTEWTLIGWVVLMIPLAIRAYREKGRGK